MIWAFLSICGLAVLFYLGLRMILFAFESGYGLGIERKNKSFYERHLLAFGFVIIAAGWIFWIVMNYPGSGSGDGMVQLSEFLGKKRFGAGHPLLSTFIMGSLFSIGRFVADSNFGIFLYCFFQTCVGAWVFSFGMKKLAVLGIPVKWCTAGIIFYAFTPFWGTYAQWFEKDLLYAEVTTIQCVFMLDIIKTKHCDVRKALTLTISSLLACLLRNNGIYAIAPSLVILVIWFRKDKKSQKRILLALLATVILYEGIVHGIYYTAVGAKRVAAIEALSIPLQQTARYVCNYGDEVTEREKEVISSVLRYEDLANYNPTISDPIKNSYTGGDLNEYYKVWLKMFFKHPGCYVDAFINKGYGYLAPVCQNIEAWIQLDYYDSMEELGIHHIFPEFMSNILIQIWNLSMVLPLFKYLCTPGFYTWILVVLAYMLGRKHKFGAMIIFVPSFINVLVCLASPLACAMRYELPTIAVIPVLAGWTYLALHKSWF